MVLSHFWELAQTRWGCARVAFGEKNKNKKLRKIVVNVKKPCFLRKWRQILRKTCTYRILKNWKIVYLAQFSKWAQILWSHWRKTQFQYIKNRIFLFFFRFCAILGSFTVILKQSGDLVKISKKNSLFELTFLGGSGSFFRWFWVILRCFWPIFAIFEVRKCQNEPLKVQKGTAFEAFWALSENLQTEEIDFLSWPFWVILGPFSDGFEWF